LDKKLSSISSLDQQEKAKVYRYLLSKGYESDLITELLATLN
jgi:SOS response regulatory protein OraA/RecX